jgi:broad specificity phosphatase PhoE
VTELLIVRHGQATFDADEYDQLSQRGWQQAERLGQWLVAHYPQGFEVVVAGAMRRHRETLAAIERCFAEAGRTLAPAQIEPALNEFDHHAVLEAYARHRPDDPVSHAAEFGRSKDMRAVYLFLKSALEAWSAGALESHLEEGWDAFSERVAAGGEALVRASAHGTPVLVVTSGGVISQLARRALELPPSSAVALNLTIRNSAIAEFRAYQGALSLQSWNALPHLAAAEDRALWTYY